MEKQKISICITNKNRSKVITGGKILYLLPDCIKSIQNIVEDNNFELVVSDWGSNDWPVEEWIEYKAPDIPIHLIKVEYENNNKFSVGLGRNIAAENAIGDLLFFVDADIILNRESFSECLYKVRKQGVCFPKINYQLQYNQPHYKLHTGAGNVLIRKELFKTMGGWPVYWSYGFEDIEFAQKIKKEIGSLPVSETPLVHQWHPKKIGWAELEDKNIEPIRQQCINENNKEVDILKQMAILNIRDPNTTHSKIKYTRAK